MVANIRRRITNELYSFHLS